MKQYKEIFRQGGSSQSISIYAMWPFRNQFMKASALYVSKTQNKYILTLLQNLVHPTTHDLCQYLQIQLKGDEQTRRLKIDKNAYQNIKDLSQLIKIQIQQNYMKVHTFTATKVAKQNHVLQFLDISKINQFKNSFDFSNYKQHAKKQQMQQLSQENISSSVDSSVQSKSLQTCMQEFHFDQDSNGNTNIKQAVSQKKKEQNMLKKTIQKEVNLKIQQFNHQKQYKTIKNNNQKSQMIEQYFNRYDHSWWYIYKEPPRKYIRKLTAQQVFARNRIQRQYLL